MSSDATLIEVALNGTTTKQANPHVPRTPAEITADALACIAAGASIVHNHNDEPMWVPDGVHAAAPYIEAWTPIVEAHPGVLLYATQAGGGPGIAIETRWAHHEALAHLTPLALVDPGSVSLGGDAVYLNSHDLAMLEGSGLPWLVAVLGGDVIGCGLARLALERGGHLRVGLEDYAGERTPTNAELVQEAAALIERAGRAVADVGQARALLGLQPPA